MKPIRKPTGGGAGLPAGGTLGQVLGQTAGGPAWVDVAGGGVTAAQFAALVARVVALEPAAPVASYLYYRFTFTANGGHPDFLLVLDVQLREFVGGTQIATGGQVSGTGSYLGYQYAPPQAFDGDPATFWLAYPAQTPTLKYQLPAAAPVRQYTLRCGGEANAPMTSMPAAWVFEGSNDNLSWDTLHTVADAGPWTEYQTKTYTI